MTRRSEEDAQVIFVPSHSGRQANEIDLIETGQDLWKWKWFILGFILLCTGCAFLATTILIIPKYQARAVLRPTEASGPVITSFLNSTHLKRKLVEEYDLLPVLYAERWDEVNKQWRVSRKDQIPTTTLVLAEGKLPYRLGANFTLLWEGPDPSFNVLMLERIIQELERYMNNEFVSDAQIQMIIFEQELAPLAAQFEGVWDQFWGMDKVNLARFDILGEYTRLKNRITDLKSQDALSRRFEVTGEPLSSAEPIFPKTRKIVLVTFVASGILAILTALLAQAHRRKIEESIP